MIEKLPSSIIGNDYDPVSSSSKNENILQIHGACIYLKRIVKLMSIESGKFYLASLWYHF